MNKEKSFDSKRAALYKRLTRDGVTSTAIKNVYGPFAMEVLQDYVKPKPTRKINPKIRVRRLVQRYGAVGETTLPTKAAFEEALNKKYTHTARKLVEDSYKTIGEITKEFQTTVDKTPKSLTNPLQFEFLTYCLNKLKAISVSKLTDMFNEVEVVRLPVISKDRRYSRWLDEAAKSMELACDAVEDFIEDILRAGSINLDDSEFDDSDLENTREIIEDIRDHAGVVAHLEIAGMRR